MASGENGSQPVSCPGGTAPKVENNCEPCGSSGTVTESTRYCKDCDEYLCDKCVETHKTIKATRQHKPVTVEEKKRGEYIACEPCGLSGKNADAENFCEECEEYLCTDCTATHKTIKATKSHTPITKANRKEKIDQKGDTSYKCEPCTNDKKTIFATQYCELCKEFLCDTCTTIHSNIKATKSHVPVPVSSVKDIVGGKKGESSSLDKCDQCEDISDAAVKFCHECNEKLCNNCSRQHSLQKITRSHKQTQLSETEFVQQLCEICEGEGKNNDAIKKCMKCDELLCEVCAKSHNTMKATKHHMLYPVEMKVDQSQLILCQPCETEGSSMRSTKYCVTCDEYYCNKCSKGHRIGKVTKSHELIDAQSAAERIGHKCEECNEEGIIVEGKYYCKSCEEYICQKCMNRHKVAKQTKHHEIISSSDMQEDVIQCVACKEEGQSVIAIKFCVECDENMCKTCCDSHKRTKFSRNHKLTDPKKMTKDQLICGPCQNSDKHIVAVNAYCKDCDEFLCKDCCEKHKVTKALKKHILVSPSEGQTKLDKNLELHCDPCKLQDKNKTASAFCRECENELLCDECVKQHKALKQTRNHDLSLDLTAYSKPEDVSDQESDGEKPKPANMSTSAKGKEKQEEPKSKKNETPGKPFASTSDIGADFLTLSWEKPEEFKNGDWYQVSYRDVDNKGKWKILPGEYETATAKLSDLKSNTQFLFRVRAVYDHGEGPYSEESEPVYTTTSPAARIVSFSTVETEGNPSPTKYILPITEIRNARNTKAKSRKFDAGPAPSGNVREKTIMLVGATGTGKSTLVDGIVNYALGVNWDDPFRFTIVNLEDEEKVNIKNQAISQTEWITCYCVNPEQGSRLPYRLNIIDTPGFGDTRGLERDQTIVEQIRQLFTEKAPKGVSCIDAVCFLIKAPDARLTAVQSYIFQSVMSLFGKDIENNICSLVTFADGIDPPVMAALLESGLPFGKHFTFNNSGLFAKNVQSSSLSPMFWAMGIKSFQDFFDHLEKNVETKSLQLTKDVLDERFRLETTVRNLQPQLDRGLLKVDQMKQEINIIEENKSLIKDNKNFEYEVTETHHRKKELQAGLHVTNCIHCNFTCHENCGIPSDGDKSQCIAMTDGKCTVCPHKCKWQEHANTPYIWEYVPVKVKKTYAEMEKKYQEASGKLMTQEQVVEKMGEDLAELSDDIEDLMFIVKECNERLSDIALRPNPLTMTEHIDLMIANEKMEKKDGFQERITTLNEFRQRAQIMADVENFSKEAQSTLGAAGTRSKRKRDTKTIWQKIGSWFKKK